MFDIAGTELLLLIALAFIFVGPKELPRLMRTLGSFVRKARMTARDFQRSFEDMANEADLKDLKEDVQEIKRSFDPGDITGDITGDMTTSLDEPAQKPKKGSKTQGGKKKGGKKKGKKA